jgi:hypothetical protein
MATQARAVREPVSLRLPHETAARVEAYADERGLRKTDAYLHFIELGLEAEGADAHLGAIDGRLDEILALLRGRPETLDPEPVRRAVARVAAEFPAIRQAYVFGSFARGDAGPRSDVDVRVVLDRTVPFGLSGLARFAKRVEQESGRECDVVSSDVIKNEALAAAIEREKVLVYEREGQ